MTEVPYVQGPMRRDILAFIAANPGCTSADIAHHLNKGHYNVSTALGILTKREIVARQRDGAEFRYVLPQAFKAPKPRRSKAAEPDLFAIDDATKLFEAQAQIDRLTAEVDRARDRLVEADAWKAAAIAKYPDLAPVDPLLAKAREIAAQLFAVQGNNDAAARITTGEYDTIDAVQAALVALRSVAP
ncbi:MAG: MarR family transcriptional regulator [Burkholderiaceae bacterium]